MDKNKQLRQRSAAEAAVEGLTLAEVRTALIMAYNNRDGVPERARPALDRRIDALWRRRRKFHLTANPEVTQ